MNMKTINHFKKEGRTGCITFLLIIALLCNCKENSQSSIQEDLPKKWTFLLYSDSDFTPEYGAYDPLSDFSERVKSDKNVNFLVLQDRNDDQAKIWFIDRNHQPVLKKNMGELNMGSGESLLEFLEYAEEKYPAEKYILSIYDHGAAFWGSCLDFTNDDTGLLMTDMQKALRDFGGVSIVQFSGPCKMGSFEAAYELRNNTEVYIGSENNSSFIFWKNTMRNISEILNLTPEISVKELSEAIIDHIYDHRQDAGFYANELTMCAIETSKMNEVTNLLDTIALEYISDIHKFKTIIDTIYGDISSFKNELVDLYDFADKFSEIETDSLILHKLSSLKQSYENAIIAECHGAKWPDVHGLTIFLPGYTPINKIVYYKSEEYDLDFVKNTHWDEMLVEYSSLKCKTDFSPSFIKLWDINGDGLIFPFEKIQNK